MHAGSCAGLCHWWQPARCRRCELRTTRIVRVLNKFCTRSEQSFKAFQTLAEIIEVTKSFLCMELEDNYLEENELYIYIYILYYLFADLLE